MNPKKNPKRHTEKNRERAVKPVAAQAPLETSSPSSRLERCEGNHVGVYQKNPGRGVGCLLRALSSSEASIALYQKRRFPPQGG